MNANSMPCRGEREVGGGWALGLDAIAQLGSVADSIQQ